MPGRIGLRVTHVNRGARVAPLEGMKANDTFTTELEPMRRELRERENEAKGLAERIASLQERIDAAVSRLDRAQQKREQRPGTTAAKK